MTRACCLSWRFDERIGLTPQFAETPDDPCDPVFTRHSFSERTRLRIFGIFADYEDQNDHHTLHSDAVFKLIAGRSPDVANLASQPTLSRFENVTSVSSLFRLQKLFVDQSMASLDALLGQLTFDIDTYDDPAGDSQARAGNENPTSQESPPRSTAAEFHSPLQELPAGMTGGMQSSGSVAVNYISGFAEQTASVNTKPSLGLHPSMASCQWTRRTNTTSRAESTGSAA